MPTLQPTSTDPAALERARLSKRTQTAFKSPPALPCVLIHRHVLSVALATNWAVALVILVSTAHRVRGRCAECTGSLHVWRASPGSVVVIDP